MNGLIALPVTLGRVAATAWHAWRAEKQGEAAPRRRRADSQFLPGVVEILEAPPPGIVWVLPLFIALVTVAAIGWSVWAEIDVLSSAEGRIVPTARVKLVQPAEAGIVRAIHVTEGAKVRAGDPVLALDPTETSADRERLQRQVLNLQIEAARLVAIVLAAEELDGAERTPVLPLPPNPIGAKAIGSKKKLGSDPNYPKSGSDPNSLITPLSHFKLAEAPDMTPALAEFAATLATAQQRLSDAQWRSFRVKLEAADREILRAEAGRDGTAARMTKLDAVRPLLAQRVAARKHLADKQLVAYSTYLELQQQLVENEEELAVLARNLAQAEAELALARDRRRQTSEDFRRDLLAELGQKERDLTALLQDLRKADKRDAQQVLLAPTDGFVQDLAVHTIGGVVRQADVLMKVVPENNPLEIEARVLNRDIGFVKPGQKVEIKVETFPYTQYGTIPGRVIDVSADTASDDPQAAARAGQAYRARIQPLRNSIMVNGIALPLTPGMMVTVDIKTGQRRVIDYVLAPVLRYRQEALRER